MEATLADDTAKPCGITIGSYISKTGERRVALTLAGVSACLTIEGARLIAKQMNEWADFQEKFTPSAESLYDRVIRAWCHVHDLKGRDDKQMFSWTEVVETPDEKTPKTEETPTKAHATKPKSRAKVKS